MKSLRRAALAAVVLVAAALPAAAQNANPQLLAFTCQGCHGTAGKSPGTIPALHGKTAEQILALLKDFRDGGRAATVMGRIAKGYTDAEIEAIAKEVASWK